MGLSQRHEEAPRGQWDGMGIDMLVCGTIGVGSLGVLALAGLFLRRSTGMRIPSSGFSLGGGGELKQLQIHAHARRVAGGQRYVCAATTGLMWMWQLLLLRIATVFSDVFYKIRLSFMATK